MKSANDGCTVYPMMFPTKSSLQTFNFYLLQQADSLTLIDAGVDSESCWRYFLQSMEENGFSIQDLTRIVLTHNHQDHAGLVNRICAVKDVPVYAHPDSEYRLKRDKEFFSMRVEFFRTLYREQGCGAAGERQVEYLQKAVRENEKNKILAEIQPITESDTIAGLQVIGTPGHSPDHLVFLDAQRKLLFAGDHLLSHISSNALIEPDREGKRILSLLNYVQSLKTCLELPAETIYPGHGEVFSNHKQLILTRLKRIEEKAGKLLQWLETGLTTASQLAQAYYPHKYESEFSLVMSEIIGHLDYLEKEKKVQKEWKGGIWHYSPTSVAG